MVVMLLVLNEEVFSKYIASQKENEEKIKHQSDPQSIQEKSAGESY